MPPKISVITINYNNKKGLEKTLKSVISQTFSDFEHIVIDGGSTDGSKDILEEHSDEITYWVSEADKGIYNAMNKGIAVAKGEYLVFLNSGDYYYSDETLSQSVKEIDKQAKIIYFQLNYIYEDNTSKKISYPDRVDFLFFTRNSLPHPGTLIHHSLFELYGKYDENMKICSDWAFFCKTICKFEIDYKYVAFPVVNYNFEGISSVPSSLKTIQDEKNVFLQTEFKLYNSLLENCKSAEEKITKIYRSRIIQLLRKLKLTKI